MSNEIKDLANEKNLQQPAENTVAIVNLATKEDRRVENKKKFAELITPEQAINLAMSQAHKKELELQAGCKLTRKERSKLLQQMTAGIQACANVGYRIKQGTRPEKEMIDQAKQYPDTLQHEIRDAAEHAPALAAEVARDAGMENLAAELATVAAAQSSAPQVAESAESGNCAADVSTVETDRALAPPQQRGIGRESEYTDEEGDAICSWIQSGKSLNSYCKLHGRQAATIYHWMRNRPSFAKNYACAHEDRADTLVEDMLDIADSMAKAGDMTEVMAGKLRIETRKWIAERMRPTKYGAKMEVKQTGRVTFQLGVPRAQDAQVIDVNPVQIDLDKA